MISVYGGSGFIGGEFCKIFSSDVIKIEREERKPESDEILYFISTTSNYNVNENLHVDINTNLNLLMDVLEYCKNENITFNFVSSGFVYGSDIINARETDIPDPKGFYSITKRTAEQLLISFCETFGCKYRIFRLSNVYGTDKTISQSKNVLAFLIDKMKRNEDIQVYDGGIVYRDYMHVSDYAHAIKLLMDQSEVNQIYNIGAGQPTYFYDILRTAKDFLGSSSCFLSIESPDFYKKVQCKNFYLNLDKLSQYNFVPQINLQQGIKQLCTN
jgi:nucleoside-diphosphate-sugar epimerase